MTELTDQFDIFSGELNRDAHWIFAISGLHRAKERMGELAATTPGAYFIYSVPLAIVVASVRTYPASKAESA